LCERREGLKRNKHKVGDHPLDPVVTTQNLLHTC
jgi:hypothetical protein